MRIVATDWRAHVSGSLKGFLTLTIDDALILKGCPWFQKGEREWIGFPSKTYTGKDGNQKYEQIIDLTESAKKDWQAAMLAAARAAFPNVSAKAQGQAEQCRSAPAAVPPSGIQRHQPAQKPEPPQDPLDDSIPF